MQKKYILFGFDWNKFIEGTLQISELSFRENRTLLDNGKFCYTSSGKKERIIFKS